jgi:hypothetical protein
MRAQITAYQAKERQVLAMEEQPLPGDSPAIVGSVDGEDGPNKLICASPPLCYLTLADYQLQA